MKTLRNLIVIIALIVITFIITKAFFPNTKTIVETETVTDTVWNDSVVYRQLPQPEPDTIIKTDTIIKYSDTTNYFLKYAHLYQKYNRRKIYNDTLKSDTSAFISVHDIVSENSLQDRSFTYINRTPTEIYKTTKIYNQRKLFIGVEAGVKSLEPSVMYKDLNDVIYRVGYDVYGKNKGLRFGIYLNPLLGF